MDTAKTRTYFLLALLLGAMVVSFLVLQPFLTTIATAAVFAVVLYPIYRRLLGKGTHRSIAALLTVIVGALILLVPLSVIGTLVVNQSRDAYSSFTSGATAVSAQTVATNVGSWLEPYIPNATEYANSISLEINSYAERGIQWIVGHIGSAFTSILAILLRALIFLMALYYFLKDGARLEKMLVRQSPVKDEEAQAILKKLSRTITSVVKGSLAIACIQGTLAGIGYMLFGVPNPALWGVSTAISALIPGVGTSLVLFPTVIYLVAVGNIIGAVCLTFWGLFLVGLIDNFLAPKLMGQGAQLHPLLILLSVLGGVALFGPAGIFLGPLVISFLLAIYSTYAGQLPA